MPSRRTTVGGSANGTGPAVATPEARSMVDGWDRQAALEVVRGRDRGGSRLREGDPERVERARNEGVRHHEEARRGVEGHARNAQELPGRADERRGPGRLVEPVHAVVGLVDGVERAAPRRLGERQAGEETENPRGFQRIPPIASSRMNGIHAGTVDSGRSSRPPGNFSKTFRVIPASPKRLPILAQCARISPRRGWHTPCLSHPPELTAPLLSRSIRSIRPGDTAMTRSLQIFLGTAFAASLALAGCKGKEETAQPNPDEATPAVAEQEMSGTESQTDLSPMTAQA